MAQRTALASLYTAIIDARNGYAEAVKDAERPDMRTLFETMIVLHAAAVQELRPAIEARDGTVDDRGSIMSTVNETVVSIRSAVTGLNEPALSAFASGEERILHAYDKAIQEAAGDPALSQRLARQRDALRDKVVSMKSVSGAA